MKRGRGIIFMLHRSADGQWSHPDGSGIYPWLWIGNEHRHNSFTAWRVILFGLSLSVWVQKTTLGSDSAAKEKGDA